MRFLQSGMLFLGLFLAASGCKLPKPKYTSPEGYNLKDPDKFNMPSSLLEISGIALRDGNSDTVYSIQDEDGRLFRQKWHVKKQQHMKFGPKGDYEDLAIFHDRFFILKSNGTLYSFPYSESVKEESAQVKERKKLVPKGEYESLYADPQNNKLYLLCKSCQVDKKKKQITGYVLQYDPATDSLTGPESFRLDLNQLKQINTRLKTSLKPSALTKNPRTGEWYILSSANKLLIVTDQNWKIKQAHKLNSSTFNQPEGLAFDKNFNLFISNEGDEITDGNIIKFNYVPKEKK